MDSINRNSGSAVSWAMGIPAGDVWHCELSVSWLYRVMIWDQYREWNGHGACLYKLPSLCTEAVGCCSEGFATGFYSRNAKYFMAILPFRKESIAANTKAVADRNKYGTGQTHTHHRSNRPVEFFIWTRSQQCTSQNLRKLRNTEQECLLKVKGMWINGKDSQS